MASPGGPYRKTLAFKEGNICIGPSLTVSIIIRKKSLTCCSCSACEFFSFPFPWMLTLQIDNSTVENVLTSLCKAGLVENIFE